TGWDQAACFTARWRHWTSPCGMPTASRSASRSTACSADSAIACRATPATASGTASPPTDLAAAARRHVAQGFNAGKRRLGREATPEQEVRRVQAVREAIGPDAKIMVDINETWTPLQARRGGRALQEAGIAWLEDPVHHLDFASLADLRRQLEITVAAG